MLAGTLQAQTTHVVTNIGLNFDPATLQITAGDTVDWQIAGNHNVVEVDQATWNVNGTTSNGGFQLGLGGGKVGFPTPGTYYYVCQPHASQSMKGTITVVSAAADSYVAELRGIQEVPAVVTLATGTVTAVLDNGTLTVSGSFEGLRSDYDSNIGSHLHIGYAGSNGPVELVLTPTLDADNRGGMFMAADNTFSLTPAQETLLEGRQMYVNLHTVDNPGGELRGQVLPQATEYFFSPLYGSNEVPRVYSQGYGAAIIERTGSDIVVTGSFNDLTGDFDGNPAGGAHLHDALPGANSGILQGLTVTVNPDLKGGVMTATDNSYTLDSNGLDALAARGVYVNIHSTAHPSGELRGQVHGMAQAIFRASVAGANEVPPVMSMGGGQVLGELMNDTLRVVGTFSGLESDYDSNIGSHLHVAYAGRNGGVEIVLTPNLDGDNRGGIYEAADNTYELDATQQAAVLGRQVYLNIHSEEQPTGELRGQMLPTAQAYFNAYTAGGQEATPVMSRGYGHFIGEFSGDRVIVTGSFQNLESDYNSGIGSHLHRGYYGRNGGIAVGLTPMLASDNRSATYAPEDNTFSGLTSGLVDSLLMRAVYVNIHSTDVPSGELRGQMLREAPGYFFTPLSGTNEVPPVRTDAAGGVAIELYSDRGMLTGSFDDLASDFNPGIGAHIHGELPGRNGGVLVGLDYELDMDNRGGLFLADSNQVPMSMGLIDSLKNGYLYVNVHSNDIPSGEVRGTIRPLANAYLTTTLEGLNEVQPIASPGTGALALSLIDSSVVLAGSFEGLDGDFDASVAGGSHLHMGKAYENGNLFVILAPEVSMDLKRGIYVADSNRFQLTAGQLDMLVRDGIYFNLHTTTNPGGELRGQILSSINFFPDAAPAITAPMSGAALTIEGAPSTPFQATWSEATDQDTLVYIWQLSPDPDFSTLLVNSNVGTAPNFTTDFATVDALLDGAGITVGNSVTLYHRAIASDGAVQTIGTTDSVELTRGTVTSVREAQAGLQVSAQPTRVSDRLTLSIQSDRAQSVTLQLLDLQGRVHQRSELSLMPGRQNYGLTLSGLAAGVYFVRLDSDQSSQTLRVIKQ